MFKILHQTLQNIKDYYIEYKKENDKIKELNIILNYLFKLDYYFINCKSYYEKYYNTKQHAIYIDIYNIPNNMSKLHIYKIKYFNNLPLHLKWISLTFLYTVKCNLPPNLIFLDCSYCDIYNLPKSLIFLFTFTDIHNEIIFNNDKIKNKIFILIINYVKTSTNNYNKITYFKQQFYNYFYILK